MKISVRQICFILIFYTAASKFLQYPPMLSAYSGRDLLFSALFGFAADCAAIWAVAFLSSRTDKTFYELLKDNLGTVAARIVYGFFAAFFILITILPLFEQKQFVHAVFYDTTPPMWVFLPVFLFLVYVGSKGFTNIGRCAEVCMPIFILMTIALYAMSFGEAKFSNLLPLFKTPLPQILGGSLRTSYYFAEPAYLLMFMGHYKYKKHDAAKLTLSYAAGAVIVLVFLALFYGIYAGIASSRQFAITKTALFFSATEMVGRIDLLALYVLETVMLFALVLNIQLAVHCIKTCSGFEYPEIISLCVNAVLLIILTVFNHDYTAIRRFYAGWVWIAVILFTIVIPAAAWLLKRRRDET